MVALFFQREPGNGDCADAGARTGRRLFGLAVERVERDIERRRGTEILPSGEARSDRSLSSHPSS
jgi:hypothetical protein